MGIEVFSDDLFELSLINLETVRPGVDRKISNTTKKYLLNWFNRNNKILFFIASNEERKAAKRIALFSRWYDNLSNKQKEKFELNIQSFTDGLDDVYIGFIFRKDFQRYNEFKLNISEIINKIESSKE